MIRIAGGILRGRRIQTPGDLIRPSQEKVRQALFSSLAAKVGGCRFLDLFAGSGAVGLEALSRGAGYVCWVELHPRVLAVLRRNVVELSGDRPEEAHRGGPSAADVRIVRADAVRFVEKAQVTAPFDIIFADPPYDAGWRDDWLRKTLQALACSPMLAPDGIFVAEQRTGEPVPDCPGWKLTRDKAYGGTQLRFFER